MTKLRKGDQVIVVAGADKGKTGRLLRIDGKHGKAVVEGVNVRYKHVRRSQEHQQGGRIQREFPVHLSNLAFLDAESGKGTRLGYDVSGGTKVRVRRPSGKPVD